MKRRINTSWIVIFFVGVIASLSLAAMHEDGTCNFKQFYDSGTVYNYQSQFYNISTDTINYELANNSINVQSDDAVVQYWLETDDYRWNYMICDIKKMNAESIIWDMELLNAAGQIVEQRKWELKQGKNILELGVEKFKGMNIHISNQNGLSYTINNIEFRDKLSVFSVTDFLIWAAVYMIIYLCMVLLIRNFMKKKDLKFDFYKPIDLLQSCYIRIGNYGTNCKWSGEKRSRWRTILFFTIFLLSVILTNLEIYTTFVGYKYTATLCVILTYVIIFISIEKPLEKKNWRAPIAGAWFSLWGLSVVSDFIVDKFYFLTGWMMLLCFTFFYFVIQNMKNPYQIIDDFSRAMQYSFIMNVAGNILCRPENPGQRYCGMYKNPNVFSFYLVIILVLFLLELDKLKAKQKSKGSTKYVIGIFLILQQLWMAQSLTGVLMALTVGFFWVLRRRMIYRREEKHERISLPAVLNGIKTVAGGILCGIAFAWCINHVPQLLGTQVIYPEDFYQMQMPKMSWGIDVYAAERNAITNSRLYQKVFQAFSLDSLTTGRVAIYLQFIQNMNLWGHYSKLNIAGSKWSAHNELLGIAFRYGVFAIVPYIAFLWYAFKNAVTEFFSDYRKNPYVFCILGVIVVSILKLSVDKFEQPFRSAGWMAFYFLIGFLYFGKGTDWRSGYETEDTDPEQ